MILRTGRVLPLIEPVASLDEYITSRGSEGLAASLRRDPDAVIDEVRAAGLRGRGGAGFPTATKWASVPQIPQALTLMRTSPRSGDVVSTSASSSDAPADLT